MKKHIDPAKISIVKAGDFENAKKKNREKSDNAPSGASVGKQKE
jgi:hypothetical protein